MGRGLRVGVVPGLDVTLGVGVGVVDDHLRAVYSSGAQITARRTGQCVTRSPSWIIPLSSFGM